jgi:hypothetical protein
LIASSFQTDVARRFRVSGEELGGNQRASPSSKEEALQMSTIVRWWDDLTATQRVLCGVVALGIAVGGMPSVSKWIEFGDNAKDLADVVALFLGGGWVLYQYGVRRSGESGLSIGTEVRSKPFTNGLHLVAMEVALKNTGNCRITAKPDELSATELGDLEHSIRYSCDLQIRRVRDHVSHGRDVRWWEGEELDDLSPAGHIDLLIEYTRPDDDTTRGARVGERPDGSRGMVNDFFMEPGEEYSLGRAVVLRPGHYLAKIVFLGNRNIAEFWSRTIVFTVPTEPLRG